MAISTYKVFLMKKGTGDTYAKLADIKDYPDLGGEKEMLETTTLSDPVQTHTPGIEQADRKQFTLNYDEDDYDTLKALETANEPVDLSVWFGGTDAADGGAATPTGDKGKYNFSGYPSVYLTGKGVNEVVEMVFGVALTKNFKKVTE